MLARGQNLETRNRKNNISSALLRFLCGEIEFEFQSASNGVYLRLIAYFNSAMNPACSKWWSAVRASVIW